VRCSTIGSSIVSNGQYRYAFAYCYLGIGNCFFD